MNFGNQNSDPSAILTKFFVARALISKAHARLLINLYLFFLESGALWSIIIFALSFGVSVPGLRIDFHGLIFLISLFLIARYGRKAILPILLGLFPPFIFADSKPSVSGLHIFIDHGGSLAQITLTVAAVYAIRGRIDRVGFLYVLFAGMALDQISFSASLGVRLELRHWPSLTVSICLLFSACIMAWNNLSKLWSLAIALAISKIATIFLAVNSDSIHCAAEKGFLCKINIIAKTSIYIFNSASVTTIIAIAIASYFVAKGSTLQKYIAVAPIVVLSFLGSFDGFLGFPPPVFQNFFGLNALAFIIGFLPYPFLPAVIVSIIRGGFIWGGPSEYASGAFLFIDTVSEVMNIFALTFAGQLLSSYFIRGELDRNLQTTLRKIRVFKWQRQHNLFVKAYHAHIDLLDKKIDLFRGKIGFEEYRAYSDSAHDASDFELNKFSALVLKMSFAMIATVVIVLVNLLGAGGR